MKRQRRLESFFQAQREERTYFYLDWCAPPPYRAQWLSEKPITPGITFEAEVQWIDLKLIVTLGARLPVPGEGEEEPRSESVSAPFISLLKSQLQKCVRRQLTQKAMRTARLLMTCDFSLFVRRLAIIMLEDVMLHDSLPALVWLTAALSKGFRATHAIQTWLLSIVHYLCEERREAYWSQSISNDTTQLAPARLKEAYRAAVEREAGRDMLLSLLFRRSYGGMPGDMAMLMSFVSLLLSSEEAPQQHIASTPLVALALENVPPLRQEETELCAVDFHCYPQMLMMLKRENPSLEEKSIRAAIWHHNSKFNSRVQVNQQEREKMEALRAVWRRLAWRVAWLQKEHIRVTWTCYANGIK